MKIRFFSFISKMMGQLHMVRIQEMGRFTIQGVPM